MAVWCNKCGSDIEGVHYGSCPDHPTNQALSTRGGERKPTPEQPQQPNVTSHPSKASWFRGETSMKFSQEQVYAIYEHFLTSVLDIPNAKVTHVAVRTGIQEVTFKTVEPKVEVVLPMSTEEVRALNEVVSEGQANKGT